MRKVYVVGLGPGDSRCLTAEARSALDEAHVLCGYGVYVDLVAPLYPEKEVFTTPMTQELERCRWGLCPVPVQSRLPQAAGLSAPGL